MTEFMDIFTEVEALPTVHRAIRLTEAMILDATIARPLADMIHARVRNTITTAGEGVRASLEMRNWETPDGPLVPVYPGDWLVEAGGIWVAFDPAGFEKMFREHRDLIILHERSLTEGP